MATTDTNTTTMELQELPPKRAPAVSSIAGPGGLWHIALRLSLLLLLSPLE